MSCGVDCRLGLDPALLWLWRRPVAITPIQPLAWEPPYVAGAALEETKKKKKEKSRRVWIDYSAVYKSGEKWGCLKEGVKQYTGNGQEWARSHL